MQICRLSFQQAARRTWCWVPAVTTFLVAALLISRGEASWESFYRHPAVLPALILFPLIVCAGIVAAEVSSGRALLLHALGASRKQFVIGRLLGAAAFCWSCLLVSHLMIGGYLVWTGNRTSWRAAIVTAVFAGSYFVYMAALLVALSTFIRSWGNSAVLLGLQTATAILGDLLVSGEHGDPGQWIRLARLLFVGPLRLVVQSASGALPDAKDVAVVLALLLNYTAAGAVIYHRAEIGRWVGRE